MLSREITEEDMTINLEEKDIEGDEKLRVHKEDDDTKRKNKRDGDLLH